MNTTARSIAAAVAVLALTLSVGAGAALAADPTAAPTVGGQIDAYGNKSIVVTSHGNVPAHVTLSSATVGLSESEFDLQPEGKHTVTFTGEPVGTVEAHFTIIKQPGLPGDLGSATLVLGLKPYTPPFNPAPWGVGALSILAFALILRRTKPWTLRLTRASA